MRLRRRRAEANPDGSMPLMDHLRELRKRVVKAAIFIALGIVAGFMVFEPVWEFLKAPYCALPAEVRGGTEGSCDLIFTGIFDAFFLRFKVAIIIGLLVSCPFWLYQLWAFVAPGLQGREKGYTYAFVGFAVPLFLGGSALAYYVTQKGMEIMFGFAPEGTTPLITMDNYLSYIIMMLLVFGAAFVLPLIVVLLNFLGALSHATIAKWRRMILFLAFVFAAIATPGGDPITMLALAVPVVVLFEIAELVAFLNDRRKGVAEPYGDLDDDEVSPLEEDETSEAAPKR
ncbi:sec-independent protein translocase protein TatC [Spinactinospora alkalitolerans]|uniref:Sec-independent protein translocase protein TatC n=2 Tax=Spinactinospora alkalitolerans TaxID=687207 RepID=A0A852TRD5_9ACTN|nr:twin-arginine translocase subunit TatC [Spinactinospora alkalitolerans]NYE46956.1 sec-independent protein translocase protein TatC [Spinactinospora alkalitolerans]